MWVTLGLLLAYAVACGVATWLENDFGTPSAKALVYGALWFDLLHLLLSLNLLGVIIFSRMWQRRKRASFLLHCSFLLIVVGAGVTRYFGVEGGMHIREGESSNLVISSEKYLTLYDKDSQEEISFPVVFTPLHQKHFSQTLTLSGKTLTLKTTRYTPLEESEYSAPILEVELSNGGESRSILLIENYVQDNIVPFTLGDSTYALNWGPRFITLPFSLRLDDFILERYAGSNSPSSYESIVQVIEGGESKSYKIFMNNVLDYGGYRFFQSSYDEDEQGTILSVNKDIGKYPTYAGYTLLILASLWILLSPSSRISALRNYLKAHSQIALALCLFALTPSFGDEGERVLEVIEKVKTHSKEHSAQFSSLLVQDFGGRVKPMDSMAMDFVHKMTKKDSFLGMDYNQIFLGMLVFPDEFRAIKMFPIKSPALKDTLGIPQSQKYIAYNDLIGDEGYKLINYIQEANRKKPQERSTFDKEVLGLNERFNIAYLIYSGEALRVFPDMSGESQKWFSPSEMPTARKTQIALMGYLQGLREGIEQNSWEDASIWLDSIKSLQSQYGSDISPSKQKITLEIWLNHCNIFYYLIFAYLLLGLALLLLSLYSLLSSPLSRASFGVFVLLWVCMIIQTLGLIVRWIVGDHAPWSNAYESMIFISWASVVAGVVFFPKSYLTQAMASLLSAIVLFVANLGFMDPQIGNLVPVLKSYWLNIHVFVITASYGFLGLSLMLGLVSLILFIFRAKREKINQSLLNLHCINEISMIIGLLMLTAGNFLGGVWANESWGRYWGWDPKETWALISIIIYTIILHLRFIPSLNSPYVFAVASIWGFYSILMTYFGVNYYLSGMHSYASGDNLPIPTFLWYCLGVSVLLPLLAFPQRGLKAPKMHK
ncbi:cytochrome C biogenesis protein [Helicobacter brantae]|uniref:Cytochrome C biogenesis protein n=2 Tax=Helicobacter brantae TaxID=375927 RepID=A0A3D8J314_9HELI|nr:cytochrome c biogenesis protein CcsA [Helicobacter brantae]RDU71878.1 cytochrome C biogenesis protein [Helicobacter brantae]